MESTSANQSFSEGSQTTSFLIPAGRFKRWVATVLDDFFVGLVQLPLVIVAQLIVLGRLSLEESDLDKVVTYPLFIVMAILIFGFYKIGFLVKDEATPGKRWSKLKVVQYSGQRINLLRASVREIGKIMYYIPLLGLLPYFTSVVLVLFSEKRRALHDLIAGTIVIRAEGN